MAYIKINSKYPLYDGMPITFKAPCDCTGAEGLTVNSTNFIFKDAHGNALAGIGNLFGKDALVKVILDKTNGFAYIQNADSNKYLEDRMSAAEAGVNTNGASIENNRKSIASLASRVDRNDKRLTTIESVVYGDLAQETEDNTVAYTKDVPANARGTAKLNTLGGMTRKCTNLLPYPYNFSETEIYGVNVSVNSDGYFHIKGTPTQTAIVVVKTFDLPAGTYTATVNAQAAAAQIWDNNGGTLNANLTDTFRGSKSFTLTSPTNVLIRLFFYVGVAIDETCAIMLNEGSTALPYEPYFEGLRSAPVTEVESVGVNLFDISKLSGMDRLVVSGDKINITTVSDNSCATSASRLKDVAPQLKVGDTVTLSAITTGSDKYIYLEEALMAWYYGVQQTITEVMLNSRISFYASGVSTSATISEIMLNKGSALPYTPYTRNTLPIPSAIQALDGYGWGVNESVYNYIDYEKKQFVKRVGKVDIGTLENYYIDAFGTGHMYFASHIANAKYNGIFATANALCAAYEITTANDMAHIAPNMHLTFYDSSKDVIIRNTNYTDAVTFKAAMSGVMLYYELATPEVTDISDILPEDNYIGVEGGGTLTFKNEYEYDVPSEVTYITKGATV